MRELDKKNVAYVVADVYTPSWYELQQYEEGQLHLGSTNQAEAHTPSMPAMPHNLCGMVGGLYAWTCNAAG